MSHQTELERRYVGIDYVAEFQRHWSYLNRWFRTEYATDRDRDGVEQLKTDARVARALHTAVDDGHETKIINRISGGDERHGDVDIYRYSTPTVLSELVAAVFAARPTASAMNLYGPQNANSVRGTATVHVDLDEFLSFYWAVTALGDLFMDQEVMSVAEALSLKGIKFAGSMFYRDDTVQLIDASRKPFAEACWNGILHDPELGGLVDLANSHIAPGLQHDVMEMIYVVRNRAVHGDLDFMERAHNRVARSALAVLDRIVSELLT
jgi:hypothetical protein